jgi:hypothetical protein
MFHPRSAFVAAIALSCLAGCSTETAEPLPPGAPTPQETVGIVIEDDEMAKALAQANQVQVDEGRIKQQQAAFLELSERYLMKTGRRLPAMRMTADQAALLQTLMSKEGDVEVKGLLQEIIHAREKAGELKDEIDKLKAQLPAPTIAKRGDSHLKLAADYLTRTHGVPEAEAKKLAARTLLTDQLAPGMEVWHFYADGVYASTVTQGTAKVSPYFLNMRAFQKMKTERDEAVQLAAALEAEITVLEAQRDQLQRDLSVTREEKAQVEEERDELTEQVDDLVTAEQSAWFYVDTTRSLREKDVLAPIGMKLKEWRRDLFEQRIDLREQRSIRMDAGDFGVKAIKKVALLPQGLWQEKRDWHLEVEEGARAAILHLDDPEKFKGEAFVVVLR